MARELPASIIHTDDFASFDDPIDWWPTLIEKALKPILAGQPATFVPTNWGVPTDPERVVAPAEFVIIEGFTASRVEFRPYLAYSVWIETPHRLRLRRNLERSGPRLQSRPELWVAWDRWMAAEDAYVQDERPADHANVVLRGEEDLLDALS